MFCGFVNLKKGKLPPSEGKISYLRKMKVAEKHKLDIIPSKIDSNEILHLVRTPEAEHDYFIVLKSVSNSDDKEISDWLDISEKTFRNHKGIRTTTSKGNRARKKLRTRPMLKERVIMLISLFKHGIEIFGDGEKFKEWLKKENSLFGQKKPMEFIDTASGIKFVDDRLTGIEYGDNV